MSSSSEESIDDIYALMDSQGKVVPPVPTPAFLGLALVGVPFWLTVLLPLSVVTQVGKALVKPFVTKPEFNIDTGTVVNDSDIVPREDRKYDVVVLGATGFTGKLVAEHICRTYGVGKKVKWAIAGRSQSKLDQVKKDLSELLGNNEALSIDTLVVDTSVVSTLPTLVKDTRAVITTAGPFQRYGSNVVEFCAKYGTHYVDITGELHWLQNMIVQWQETAIKTGAKIVSMCGHDCVPWDLTVMKLEEALPDGEELISVDCLNDAVLDASGGTFETMIMGTSGQEIPAPNCKFDPLRMLPDGTKSPCTAIFEPSLLVKKSPPINGRMASTYASFFVMALVNADIVKRSTALRQTSKNVLYHEYAALPDFKSAFCLLFGQIAFFTALFNPVTSTLLQKFVLPAPGQGPSRDAMENKHFLAITAQGIGSKGTKVESVMYFPRDTGYMDTARMVAESGLTLALDAPLLSREGGFFTSSTGMGNVLLDRLCRTGTKFALKVHK
jgi:short subunit dehydrogenase-like uncharacterized protein